MAHVEELRQIHADINAMETIIKQAEESRRAAQVNTNNNSGFLPRVRVRALRAPFFLFS
jgi:hypothetical protein